MEASLINQSCSADQVKSLSQLSFEDLRAEHPFCPQSISLRIKHSKTDQGRQGVTLIIGRIDDDLCPITALLSLRGNSPGPLFQWEDDTPLAKPRFVEEALTAANLPAHKFAGHSFRRGAAKTAGNPGFHYSDLCPLEEFSIFALHQTSA